MNASGVLANGLYPIVRRARRPLVTEAAPVVAASVVAPPSPSSVANVVAENVLGLSGESPDRTGESPVPPVKGSDAKATSKRRTLVA